MIQNFTTGIPEIDRLTGSKIKSGSFLVLTGNDDEGMTSFLAAIEKSNGRPAEKEEKQKTPINRNEKENSCRFLKIHPSSWKPGSLFHTIFVIENITAEMETAKNQTMENQTMEKESDLVSQIIRIRNDLLESQETSFLIGCLPDGVLTTRTENRLKNIADSHFRLEMRERGDEFERLLLVYKFRSGRETDSSENTEKKEKNEEKEAKNEEKEAKNEEKKINGKIFRYIIKEDKFQIENKKRIY
ncbi:hypothetical protein [Methanolapillus ohkumae]|uniref:Uncharacterized protein n=1 Tax=Methanolapillus ohkumae TaxID=3028298 RepID=A0AA96V7U9_9EURY|nr:hypothetical protein MsAm2_10470 [Methanosarcinaceae archaeon Am2]